MVPWGSFLESYPDTISLTQSVMPDILEPVGGQLGVAHSMLNAPVPEAAVSHRVSRLRNSLMHTFLGPRSGKNIIDRLIESALRVGGTSRSALFR